MTILLDLDGVLVTATLWEPVCRLCSFQIPEIFHQPGQQLRPQLHYRMAGAGQYR